MQNTTNWDMQWIGLVNLPVYWDPTAGGVVTDEYTDIKTMSNPWDDIAFQDAATAKVTEMGWDAANVQVVISLNYNVKNGTVWYDDIVVQEGATPVEPQHLSVVKAVQPQTRVLTVAPNGRLVGDAKRLNAANFLIELKNGVWVQKAVLGDR
ncbi:MAG: hypothetical protein GF331_07720 [Chitinivibrionales bacterium]|nr:hypothetical protein [Chitinivibrionales bacterium]